MKKLILSIAMVGTLAFAACSDSESNDCTSCNDLAGVEGLSIDICDNGDGTAEITSSFAGVSSSETIDLDGENIDDLDCSDFGDISLKLQK